MSEEKRRTYEQEQAARVENTDDAILALADEIYADLVQTQVQRIRGERQKGALVGLGFKGWMGPWGAWADPDRPSAITRILNSLRHKPYYTQLVAAGLRHPQRRVELRAEYLRPYCRIDTRMGTIHWGLEDTRERAEVFKARYDVLELKVWDHGEIVAKVQSETFDNGITFTELKLDDDDYRFEVGARNQDWGYSGKWFDFALIDGEWRELDPQGRGWDGEWEGSTRTHSGTERIVEPTARERAAASMRRARIERENRLHGPVATAHGRTEVAEKIAAADAQSDTKSGRYWRIIKRIQDDRAAAQGITAEEESEEAAGEALHGDPKAAVIAYVTEVRDNPSNPAVRGNPHHITKWNRVLALLGEPTGEEKPFTLAEIRVRAEKWPQSPWAKVADMLEDTDGPGNAD